MSSHEQCWCCRPIGPGHREPLPGKTVEEIMAEADEMARLYYEVHPEESPPAPPRKEQS